MTETRLKELESNRKEKTQTAVKLETKTAESKQHALELETMRRCISMDEEYFDQTS